MEERKKRERGIWKTHFITLLSCCNYNIYTATMEGRPLQSNFSLSTRQEKEEGSWEGGGGGGGVASVMAPVRRRGPYGPFPRCTLQPQNVSAVCLFQDLYRYKTEGCLFIFLPLGGNLDRHSTQGHAVASI